MKRHDKQIFGSCVFLFFLRRGVVTALAIFDYIFVYCMYYCVYFVINCGPWRGGAHFSPRALLSNWQWQVSVQIGLLTVTTSQQIDLGLAFS